MNLPEGPKSVHSLDVEGLLSQAHRSRDLLTGAKALLVPVQHANAHSACHSILEARALIDMLVRELEWFEGRKPETVGNQGADQTEAARLAGGVR